MNLNRIQQNKNKKEKKKNVFESWQTFQLEKKIKNNATQQK